VNKAVKEVILRGGRNNFILPISNLSLKTNKMSISRFNKYFEDASKTIGQHYVNISLYTNSSNMTYQTSNMTVLEKVTQSEIVLINRLRAKHIFLMQAEVYNLDFSLHKKNMDSPACMCGDPRQTNHNTANYIIFYGSL